MAEDFLSLDSREQGDILRTVAARSGRAAVILEKDIWVGCGSFPTTTNCRLCEQTTTLCAPPASSAPRRQSSMRWSTRSESWNPPIAEDS